MHAAPKAGLGLLLLAALCGSAAAKQEPVATPTPAPPERQRMLVGKGPGGKTVEIAVGPGSIFGKD